MSNQPVTRSSLLIRIRDAENDQAWQAFVEIYTPLIYGFCRRHGLQDADAADVAQEVMKTVAGAIRKFDYDPERGTFRSWLFTVTRSKLKNLILSQQRQPETAADSAVLRRFEEHSSPAEEVKWDRDYYRNLFEWAAGKVRTEVQSPTWQAFWQTAMENKSGHEVAAHLGMNVSAVYTARSRVLARLKTLIEEATGEPPTFQEMPQ